MSLKEMKIFEIGSEEYEITDGKARNELETFIDSNKCEFIFPRAFTQASDGNNSSGDINIIRVKDKVIMIDCQDAKFESEVLTFLSDNNITHVDYFILTHYDLDHFGNLEKLINEKIIDSNTTIYVAPRYSLQASNYDTIQGILTNANLTSITPEELSYFTIGNDFKLTFYNSDVNYDDTNYTNGNECSIVCLVEHGNTKALYTGDSRTKVYEKMLANDVFTDEVDLFKIEHHGINSDTSIEYLDRIKPKYAVQTSGVTDYETNTFNQGVTISYLKELDTKIFSCHDNTEDIIFISNRFTIKNMQGKMNDGTSNVRLTKNIFVNASTTNVIQNGTEQYPYKDLAQAINSLKRSRFLVYNIKLANGTYNLTGALDARICQINGMNVYISGNSEDKSLVVLKAGFNIRNSNVSIKDLTISVPSAYTSHVFRNYFSKIKLFNCNFTTDDSTKMTKADFLVNYDCSYVFAQDCSFTYMKQAIASYDNSEVNVINSTFDNCTTCLGIEKSKCSIENCTFTNYTNLYRDSNSVITTPIPLFEGDSISGELNHSVKVFKKIKVYYKTSDNKYDSVEIYNNKNNANTILNKRLLSGTKIYEKLADLSLSEKTFTLSKMKEGGISTETGIGNYSDTNCYTILKIEGFIK